MAAKKAVRPPASTPSSAKLQFNYLKSPEYREIACHGAIGGVTPQGQIWLALFAERGVLPRLVEYELPAPKPGTRTVSFNEKNAKPSFVDSRKGIVRHVEFSAYMDRDTAQKIHDWLGSQLAVLQKTKAPK